MKVKISFLVLLVAFFVALSSIVAWGTEPEPDIVKTEDQAILFLCYWELNENMPVMQHVGIAKMLTEAGLFPPEGVEIIRFDKTPDNWGVTLFKANSAQAANSLITLWRVSAPGFFKMVKMSPAVPVKESAANAAKLYQSVKEAEAKMKEKEKTSPGK
jgi:hypothetical protein